MPQSKIVHILVAKLITINLILKEEDQFMKTECLHFFHKHCLGCYITNMQVFAHFDSKHESVLTLTSQDTYSEQVAEAVSQNSNVTVKEFCVTCPVCRETIGES